MIKFLLNKKNRCELCLRHIKIDAIYLKFDYAAVCEQCAEKMYFAIKKVIDERTAKADAFQKPNDGKGTNGSVLHFVPKGDTSH